MVNVGTVGASGTSNGAVRFPYGYAIPRGSTTFRFPVYYSDSMVLGGEQRGVGFRIAPGSGAAA